MGILETLLNWFIYVLAFWGLGDLYMMYRMRRSGYIDKTAALWNWFNLKWTLVTRAKIVAEKLPFLTKDLTEVVGVKKDDGEVT